MEDERRSKGNKDRKGCQGKLQDYEKRYFRLNRAGRMGGKKGGRRGGWHLRPKILVQEGRSRSKKRSWSKNPLRSKKIVQ